MRTPYKRRIESMKTINPALSLVREFLFPSGCALCGDLLREGEDAFRGLCGKCREAAAPDKGPRCSYCGKPLISETGDCLECRGRTGSEGPERTMVLYPYSGDYRKLLSAYKFGKSLGVGRFLAEQVLKTLETFPGTGAPVLVPVPPRPGKIKEEGWDQIEYLARILEKNYPLRRCLKRLSSEIQKKLSGERRKTNLQGRIRVKGKVPAEIIILDDVITTGSTLAACAAPLREAGALRVYGLCLFHG